MDIAIMNCFEKLTEKIGQKRAGNADLIPQ
jgi:hypothetical protein